MAAYAQPGFVVAIISKDSVIRESNVDGKRVARLNFGSEYKIRIQNKSNARAYAQILIDGTEIHTGKFILNPQEKIDLERFTLDGDLSSGKRFKFESKDHANVQDPTSLDNGNVEVIFEPEDYISTMLLASHTLVTNNYAGILRGIAVNSASDRGATVEGGQSSQQFKISNEEFRTFAPVLVNIQIRGTVVSENSPKPWSVEFKQGRSEVKSRNSHILDIESTEITATHLVLRIPLSQVSLKGS